MNRFFASTMLNALVIYFNAVQLSLLNRYQYIQMIQSQYLDQDLTNQISVHSFSNDDLLHPQNNIFHQISFQPLEEETKKSFLYSSQHLLKGYGFKSLLNVLNDFVLGSFEEYVKKILKMLHVIHIAVMTMSFFSYSIPLEEDHSLNEWQEMIQSSLNEILHVLCSPSLLKYKYDRNYFYLRKRIKYCFNL